MRNARGFRVAAIVLTPRRVNVRSQTGENALRDAFGKYGKVIDVHLPKDRATGDSRGFGFVTYDDVRDAEDAVRGMDGYVASVLWWWRGSDGWRPACRACASDIVLTLSVFANVSPVWTSRAAPCA